MSSPILHGTALCPLLRFPRGARLRLKVIMDADLPLEGKGLLFAARSRYATAGARPLFRITRAGTAAAWTATSPNTIELTLAPSAVDETEDSELTLADFQADKDLLWRLDVLDGDQIPLLRLQGDMEWLQEEGAWPDEPASQATLPTLAVSIVAGVATVSVALVSDGGAAVDNDSVNAAIGQNPAASRAALELGDAATKNVGTTAGTVAAGDHGHTPGAIGAATAPQGVKAETAVQPGSDAVLGTVRVENSGNYTVPTLIIGAPGEAVRGFSSVNPFRIDMILNGNWQMGTFSATSLTGGGFSYYDRISAFSYSFQPYGGTDVALTRAGEGQAEVNNGNPGVYRDLILRDLISTQYIRPASFTVAVANALIGVPEGAEIRVSNDVGGACPVHYRSGWLRVKDDAPISAT